MIRFLADENFDNRILRALQRQHPDIDIIRVQDVGLAHTPDEEIIQWAAQNQRVLLTFDASTVPHTFWNLREHASVYAIIVVPRRLPLSSIIEDLVLIHEAMSENELALYPILYLPLSKS